jgi:hypothetical protein
MPPPPHSTSTLGEVHGSVLPLGSGQRLCLGMTPFASLPGPQVRRACYRAREIWRAPSVARNIQVPSEDDYFVTPTAGDMHLRSSRVARLYAELVSFPGSRNRDKSLSRDGRIVALIQRE